MRGLKFTAIAAFSLLLVMIGMVGYLFLTAEVQIVDVQAHGFLVDDDPESFEKLKASIEQDTFYGTLYQQPYEWKDASEYVYLNYSLRIRNNCLVPIDMIEVQIVPQAGDILQTADLRVKSLDLKSEGEISAQILAPKDTHSIREILVTYYMWGVSGRIKTVYGQ